MNPAKSRGTFMVCKGLWRRKKTLHNLSAAYAFSDLRVSGDKGAASNPFLHMTPLDTREMNTLEVIYLVQSPPVYR